MAVPKLVRPLALTDFTRGLEDKYPGYQQRPDGVGLLTQFLSTEGWAASEPVSTTWANVYATVTTTWTVITP